MSERFEQPFILGGKDDTSSPELRQFLLDKMKTHPDLVKQVMSSKDIDPERLTLIDQMKLDLMERVIGESHGAEVTEAEVSWMKHNFDDFMALLAAHHELLEEYRSGDRRRALEQMEELLGELHESRFNRAA
jgi:hypothetical protein